MKQLCQMLIFALFLISCKNNNISDNDIEYLNSKIEYYRISYQSTLYYENNELKEKNKGISRIEYFDSNNNILKEFTEIYGFSYNIYLYDDEGNQVGLKMFDEKGKLFYREDFTLNDNGKIISIVGYDKNGKYNGKSKIIYDFNGNILQIISFDENDKYNNSKIYAYNEEKIYSVIQFVHYEEIPNISIYSYNIEGKLIEIKTYNNGFLQSMNKVVEYDEKNRETKNITYVYDFEGNEMPSTAQYYEYYYDK